MITGSEVAFEGVEKRYGNAVVLADFNLSIRAGEFVTLLGPSGSGKTTALNALAGFVGITGGTIRIGGRSVMALPPEQRNVGMIFQSYSLFPHMTVFENVAFPLRLRRVGALELNRRVAAALEMVQLAYFGKRMPKDLSGGQRQRVAFARAVIAEPSVLLMDEPLAALDLKLREAMRLEIKRYHRTLGCTILFVTHDQGEALAMSDRIAVMGNGRIAQVDTPAEIYDRPMSRYVAEFVGKTNMLTLVTTADGGQQLVELALDIPHAARSRRDPFERLTVSVRPESLLLEGPGDETLIGFDGAIETVVFLGDTVQYGILAPTGHSVLVQAPQSAGRSVRTVGDRVRVAFSMADARPVRE